jgi:hypothetical protein
VGKLSLFITLPITLLGFTLLQPTGAASAQSPRMISPTISVDSAVYVEKTKSRGGALTRTLQPADHLGRGDRVVTVVSWYRLSGGNTGFTVTNALPTSLAYQSSAAENEEVSIDGGHHWGKLENLRIDGRQATPEDVTHVRWHVTPSAAMAGAGRIAYAGFVR